MPVISRSKRPGNLGRQRVSAGHSLNTSRDFYRHNTSLQKVADDEHGQLSNMFSSSDEKVEAFGNLMAAKNWNNDSSDEDRVSHSARQRNTYNVV